MEANQLLLGLSLIFPAITYVSMEPYPATQFGAESESPVGNDEQVSRR